MCGKVEGRGRRWRLGNSLVEHMERRIYDLYEVMFTRDTGKEKLLRDMYEIWLVMDDERRFGRLRLNGIQKYLFGDF